MSVAVMEPAVAPPPRRLRLLSQEQYNLTVASIFGADVLPNVNFSPFQRTDGLIATGAAYDAVTETQVEVYHRAAAYIAEMVVAPERRAYLIPCKPANERAADRACATKFISYVGQRLFRRPLEPEKRQALVEEAGDFANRLGDFYTGLSMVLEGLLASPKTLYIDEATEQDPQHDGLRRLDAYSLASRLSFFLWNMAPDDALLEAAAKGELFTKKGRGRVVDRMVASANLEAGARAFFNDMLAFENFDTLAKDANVYPIFAGAAVHDAREQTLRLLVDLLIRRNGDYRDIFVTRDTFVSRSLAPIYQQRATKNWTRFQAADDSPRVGLLTQIAFLTLHSHPGRSSPTLRGKALRELLLCQRVPPPPANVDFSALENPDPRLRTARERLDFHSENPVCGGCHKITDPMGLALENFDGAGQYRATEKGAPIDASGSLDGKQFQDAEGLGRALHDHPAVPSCLVRRVYAYASGGRLRRNDDPVLKHFNETFAAQGFRVPELMRAIAVSDAIGKVAGESEAVAAPAGSRVVATTGEHK